MSEQKVTTSEQENAGSPQNGSQSSSTGTARHIIAETFEFRPTDQQKPAPRPPKKK